MAHLSPPLSVTLIDNNKHGAISWPDVEPAIASNVIFTTAVGLSEAGRLASWHMTTLEEVVDHMLYLVGEASWGVFGQVVVVSAEAAKRYL